MKAGDLAADGSELQHKVRTVSDLIRHIKTRESDSETANYNLFFGAGCSVTSGIRPAGALVEEWVYELYERFNSKSPSSVSEATDYFEKNHSNWYSRENSYSSLFEKTYEFASQRRRFVEREVDGTLPSIGYAYLTSLVAKKYFNTVFTTNFDDLVNEAFYQFSNERPLLCAHDSSIKSISITSKRPKIIKLHGDYLFDDIKSTLRETESLEQNTKEKMIEFCKEFGLIVIGYSGNDRSIMDVLDFLTKQDNYLKNGVYWCLRKDDEINPTLQKLLWKEKVYPVIIDGYDELFAEIHNKILGSGLDFEENAKNSKLQKIKKIILDEENPLNKNVFICEDIKRIKEANSRQEISDFLSELNNDGESSGLSLTELRNLLEIDDLMDKTEFSRAYDLAEEYYRQADDARDKSRFISKLISISDRRGDLASLLGWCDKLVELDKNNISYIVRKSKYITDSRSRYEYLNDKVKIHDNSYRLFNTVAESGFELVKNDPLSRIVDEEGLIKLLDESLKLNPSLSNDAWKIKSNVLSFLKANLKKKSLNDQLESVDKRASSHVESARSIDERSIHTFELEIELASAKDDFEVIRGIIKKLYELYMKSDIKTMVRVNETINNALRSALDFTDNLGLEKLEKEFYEDHLDDREIKSNSRLLLSKGKYYISHGNRVDEAELYLEHAFDSENLFGSFTDAVFLNNCLEGKFTNRLQDVARNNKSKFVDRYYYDMQHELSIHAGDYSQALSFLEKSFAAGLSMSSYLTDLSYALVLSGDYGRLIEFELNNREKIKRSEADVFTINYQFAAKMHGSGNYDPVVLRNIIANTKNPSLLVAAFSILEQESDVKRIVSKQIKKSYSNYYEFSNWPILDSNIIRDYRIGK